MPQETRNYVPAITGMRSRTGRSAPKAADPDAPTPGCGNLMALLRRAPNPFVEELEQRVVQSAAIPWGVQLAAGFSRDHALATYARR